MRAPGGVSVDAVTHNALEAQLLRTRTCELLPSILEDKHACPETSNLSCLNTNLPFALEGVLPVSPKVICYRREVI